MKQITIAICDDDKIQVSLIENLLEKVAASKFLNIEIEVFLMV